MIIYIYLWIIHLFSHIKNKIYKFSQQPKKTPKGLSSTMVNTCRISFISIMIHLLFINQSAISSSARIRHLEGRDHLAHHRTHDEVEKADKERLTFVFRTKETDTNLAENVSLPFPQFPRYTYCRWPITVTDTIGLWVCCIRVHYYLDWYSMNHVNPIF